MSQQIPATDDTSRSLSLGPAAERPVSRVLFVSTSCGNGGADRLPVDLAAALRKRGVDVAFACRESKFTQIISREAGVPTIPFNIRNSGDLQAARRLADIAASQGIGVLHVHARRDFMVAVMAGWLSRGSRRKSGLPRLRIVLHSHLIRTLGEPPRLAGRFFEAGADAVIAVSGATEDFLNRSHGLRPGLVRRITNGVERDSCPEPGSPLSNEWRRTVRSEWGLGEQDVVIGMVGRLFQKGQSVLLAAAARLMETHPTLKVVLVGPERDPGDSVRFAAMAERLGAGDRVILAGMRSDIPACLAAFDILAHLPRDEAFGLALAEGMAAGLPLVSTDAGGCREVIGEGRGGCLIPAGDPDALALALAPLLDPVSGPDLRASLGREARRAAVAFSRDRQIDETIALYGEICRDSFSLPARSASAEAA